VKKVDDQSRFLSVENFYVLSLCEEALLIR